MFGSGGRHQQTPPQTRKNAVAQHFKHNFEAAKEIEDSIKSLKFFE